MSTGMALDALLAGHAAGVPTATVSGLSMDSSTLAAGDAYLACVGRTRHGVDGIAEAVARGAAAVIYDSGPEVAPCGVPCVAVESLAQKASAIAGRFYGEPSQALSVIGVTGTDGKTSTAHLTAQLLTGVHKQCGVIGTLGAGRLDALAPTGLTTPDAIALQAQLHRFLNQGDAFAVLEVSSHALDQYRCDAVHFDTAVFTTLGRDHLEYHGSEAAYFAAKRRLFTDLKPRRAIWNMDDAAARTLAAEWTGEQWTCSQQHAADVCARDIQCDADGLAFTWQCDDEAVAVRIANLYGRFNITNVLLSSAAVRAQGVAAAQIGAALHQCRAVPGRLERIGTQGAVFIDYAHTEQALAAALSALREHFGTVAHCVFGCGGERDVAKRPAMGAVAEAFASHITITDDNPRGESSQAIADDIRAGLKHPERAQVIHDRQAAICAALDAAQAGEVVLIAGKGHETEQITGTESRAFSDRAVIEEWQS